MHRFPSLALLCVAFLRVSTMWAQAPPEKSAADELRYAITLSRHGVRSPTGKGSQYNQYSVGAWPEWPVPPGYLTPHGFHLMELFGSYDRAELASQGLLAPSGCGDADKITIYADSDERTRETGKALAQGMMPGCNEPVLGLPEGTNDPLFHSMGAGPVRPSGALARAAIGGRIGGDVGNLTTAYSREIGLLDHILATCGTAPAGKSARTSLFDVPASLAEGSGDHLADLKGPLNTASTLSENLLLEYTEGMSKENVGWGCVGRTELQSLMNLHTAATDYSQRTPVIARAQAAALLQKIARSLQQASGQKAVDGAAGRPTDRALFLVGHDTNLENIAGALNLGWIIDGRRDDTPPGSAMVFELWQNKASGEFSVRVAFTAQTLDQMRNATPLSGENRPDRAIVFVPGCSRADSSCALESFVKLLETVSR